MTMSYLNALAGVAESDVQALIQAEKSYGDSWKRRGGIGAFMMLARKWDRLEKQLERQTPGASVYDIFAHVENDKRAEGVIDDIRDLRRYLLLVEAHLVSLGVPAAMTKSRDNQQKG